MRACTGRARGRSVADARESVERDRAIAAFDGTTARRDRTRARGRPIERDRVDARGYDIDALERGATGERTGSG